jgi:glycosyltransferase involved in cell wall biosynthesis
MNSHPLVSVCIPTFNGAEYLQDALDCVLGQTYPNIEIVFSDDGSTDATLEIIEKFMNEIPFPSRLEHHQQTSLAGNWNNCVAHASGEYIKFLFQDDIMRHDCISKLMELFLLDSSIGLVFSPREMICGDEEKLSLVGRNILSGCSQLHKGWTNLKQVQCGTELLSDPALIDGLWNKIGEPSIVLLRRQVVFDVGGFDPNLRQWLDLDMWYRVMALSKVGFIDENLSSFRVHNHQVSIQNEESGVTAIDTLAFAEKIICSDYFLNLSPIVQKKLIKFVTPISWCKRTRRNLKRRAAALLSRLLGD